MRVQVPPRARLALLAESFHESVFCFVCEKCGSYVNHSPHPPPGGYAALQFVARVCSTVHEVDNSRTQLRWLGRFEEIATAPVDSCGDF